MWESKKITKSILIATQDLVFDSQNNAELFVKLGCIESERGNAKVVNMHPSLTQKFSVILGFNTTWFDREANLTSNFTYSFQGEGP